MNIPYLAFVPLPTRSAPLRPPHPARASHRWHTHMLLRHPHPRPALPTQGEGSQGDTRWEAAPGGGADASFTGEGGESQNPVPPPDLPVQWTVVDIATGEGPGGAVPSRQNDARTRFLPLRHPPPPPALPESLLPTRGAGAVRGDIRWEAVPGSSADVGFPEEGGVRARTRFLPQISPCSGPWWISPRGGTGRGSSLPAKWAPCVPLRQPPPSCAALLPAPHPGRGAVAISGGKPCQGAVLTSVSRKTGKNRPGRTG